MKRGSFFHCWDLVMVVATPIFIRYFLLKPLGTVTSFSTIQFALFVLSIFCLTVAGKLLINLEASSKTKHSAVQNLFSEKIAYRLFFLCTIVGVALGFYLSNAVNKPGYAAIFIGTSVLTYFYATSIRGYIVLGNFLLSLLIAFIILGTGIFELVPAITPENQALQTAAFSILLKYAGLSFLTTWLRALLTNQLEINADYRNGWKTFPVILGRSRTNVAIFTLNFGLLLTIIYGIITYLYPYRWMALYALFFVLAPLLIVMVKSLPAKSSKNFETLHFLVQLTQFFILISLIFFQVISLKF